MGKLLDAALSYRARGWAVIPLHTPTKGGCSCGRHDCSSSGKHPRTQHGLKDATTEEATIRAWWERWPEANVGVVAGALSGLVVLDQDGAEAEESLQGKLLPRSPCAKTGKGLHRNFRHPGGEIRNSVRFLPGLDLRADGGYVVAPPSLHSSGHRYEWADSLDPETVELAPCPAWLLELAQEGGNSHTPAPPVEEHIPEGQRNATLTSLAGSMRRRDMSEKAILAALREENAIRCAPPLLDSELVSIAHSIARYPPAASVATQAGTEIGRGRTLMEVIDSLHWTEGKDGKPSYRSTVKPERLLTEAVARWFDERGGKFFHDESGKVHLMFDGVLYTLEAKNPELLGLLYKEGRVTPATQEGRIIIGGLRGHALAYGQRVRAFSWLHLDTERHTIYVSLASEDNTILRISPGHTVVVPNGINDDGVILTAPTEMASIDFDPDPAEGMRLLWELVVNNLACDPSDATLAICWTLGVFTQDYCRTKPIARFAGPTLSGKTLAAELQANLVFGSDRASVSTKAANYSDAEREAFLILDNMETAEIREQLDFLLTCATGITKRKRAGGTDTETVREQAKCPVLMTGIEPPDIPEIMNRMYEIEFDEKWKSPDFVAEDVIDQLRASRGIILSAYFCLLADEILPRMARGELKQIIKTLHSRWPNHSKERTNAYLAMLWIILDAITKYLPLEKGMTTEDMITRWIERQDRLAAVGRSEASKELMFLELLLNDLQRLGSRYDLEQEITDAQGEVVGWEASHQQMLSSFKTLARNRGLAFPYDNTRQLAARLGGELDLLAKHGWSRIKTKTIKGTDYYSYTRG